MRVVVTGASGFAGSLLCASLVEDGHQVFGWSRRLPACSVAGAKYSSVDVGDASQVDGAMMDAQPDIVFHLAANANPSDCRADPTGATRTNVEGTVNVFEAMPSNAVGLYASTCHVYGSGHSEPIGEEAETRAQGVYAATKLAAEHWIAESGLPIIRARSFHHTGPTQDPAYAIADWCRQIRRGARVIRVGNLQVIRDYSDVRDIIAGYRLLVEQGAPREVYNLCSGVGSTMGGILATAIGGRPIEVVVDPSRCRPVDTPVLVGDPAKAKSIGWEPTFTLTETLSEMCGT